MTRLGSASRFVAGPRRRARLAVFATVLLLLLSACGRGGGAAPADPAVALTVTVASPALRTVEREVVASGSVAAWQEMSLGVELAGLRVAQVRVEVGDRVARGQALVELDRRTLEVQSRQAEASLAQARASVGLARAQAARGDQLLAEKLISSSNYDELQANLARAEAQLVSAEAERDAAALRLGFATLRAPEPGIISARNVQPGQVVAQGAELLRLIRDGRLEWRAEVSEGDLPRIRPGSRVVLRGPTGDSVEGRIRAVSPAIDPKSRTALIYADLPAPGALRAGMFAEGRLGVGVAEVMILPRESVVFRDGFPYVFVLGEGSRVAQRRVEIGPATGSGIELRSGLAAGDRVVVKGAGFLGDGDLVKVVQGS